MIPAAVPVARIAATMIPMRRPRLHGLGGALE
jgi:hypothetical protein